MSTIEQLLRGCPSIKLVPAHSLYATTSAQAIIDVNTPFCRAQIALQGGQVLGFNEFLWLSPQAVFDGDSAIAGGIPICLPWFGKHPHDAAKPLHGFARNRPWQLLSAHETASSVDLTLQFVHHANNEFPFAFQCIIHWRLSTALTATITLQNTGPRAMPLSFALHSYLRVTNKYHATVNGLADCRYLDNTRGLSQHQQSGSVSFAQAVDRVYEQAPSPLVLVSDGRSTGVSAHNMPTAIVWNPDTDYPDSHNDYTQFICVERGAAFGDSIKLRAKTSFTASITLAATSI